MKRVVIGMVNGKPEVLSCPKNIEVVIKMPKHRTIKKILRTWFYQIRTLGK